MNSKVKRKGFTLVELLAAVVLLGLLITGVVVGISKVVKKSRENYYVKQKELVTQAGREYFNDNRNTLPTVIDTEKCVKLSTLIGNKYIEEVVDYDNNGCSIEDSKVCATKISRTKYSYRTELSCPNDNEAIINYNKPTISFTGATTPGKNKKPTVKFSIYYQDTSDPNKNPDLSQYKYAIYKEGETSPYVESENIKVSSNTKEKKDVEAKLIDEITSSGTYYIKVVAYTKSKTDNTVTGTSNKFKIEFGLDCEKDIKLVKNGYENLSTDDKWSNKNISATVNVGNKVDSYTINVKKNNTVIHNKEYTSKGINSYPLAEDGVYEYTVTATDDSGETCSIKTYYRIDKTAPSCVVTSDKTTWTNDKQTLTAKCTDDGSGCIEAQRTKTFSEDKDEEYVFESIYDKAGNVGYCNSVRVMVDKQKPTCKITSSGTTGENGWYTSNVNISFSEKNDNHTSADNLKYVISNSSTTPTTFNNQNVQLTTDTTEKTYYGYVKDEAGNIGTCSSSIKVKKDSSKPECNMTDTGTKTDGIYSGDVTVKITPQDSISGIAAKGVTTANYAEGSFQYNNNTSHVQSNDTEGTKVYAYIKNGAGLTQKCEKEVVLRKFYKITFNLNGGSAWTTSTCSSPLTLSSNVCSKNVRIQSNYETLPSPTKTGYTLAGWYDSNSGGNKIKSTTKKTSSNNQTLYAHWNACSYSVKFNANGGTGTMSNESFTYDVEKALTTNAFTKDGSTFEGWATSANGSVAYTNGKKVKNLTTTCNGTVNLYAKWSSCTYTVKFNANGGTGTMSDESFAIGSSKALTSNSFTRNGYVFEGWATSANGSVVYTNGQSVSNLTTTCGETINLYAVWKPCTYTVKFNANGGTGTMNNEIFSRDVEKALTTNSFTRAGYSFAGWATSANGSVVYTDAKTVKNLTTTCNGTVNLYAVWTSCTYKVKFNANGGTGTMSDESFAYGSSKALTSNSFTRDGYIFEGWATSANGSVVYTNGQSVSNLTTCGGTVNLYAVWKQCTYTVKFNANGGSGTMSNEIFTRDIEKALTTNSFTRAGYSFAGWATSASGAKVYSNGEKVKNLTTTCDGTVTLYAVWTACTYKVKFNANGGTGTMSDESFTYGTEKALTDNSFTYNGQTFAGWNTKADGSGTSYSNKQSVKNLTATCNGTVNLYAIWATKTYTVTYVNGTPATQTKIHDKDLTISSTAKEQTGKTFSGWKATDGTIYNNGGTYKKNENTTMNPQYCNNCSVSGGASCTLTATNGTCSYSTSCPAGYSISNNGKYNPSCTACTYKVKFNANGGTGTMSDESFTFGTEKALTSNSFTRTGYAFAGWATSASGAKVYANGEKVKNLTTTCDGTVNLYAVWVEDSAPTCSITVSSGTLGENNYYTTNVGIKMTTSNAASYGLTTSTTTTYNSTTTATLSTDTEGTTYYGYVKTTNGKTATCSKTIKRMTKTPSCSIAATGTTGDNSWFTGNVTLTLTTTNADSYGFTDSSSATYSSTSKTITHTANTTSTKYNGYVKTKAGKTATCSKTIKKTEAPTCSFAIKSGTKGNNNWYKTNVGLGITVSNVSTAGLATNAYSISKTSTKSYTTTSSITQSDTSEITYTAYVKNAAGQETLCGTQKVKVDTIAPVIVVNSTRCITTGHGGSSGVEEKNSSRDSRNCLTDTAQTGTLSSSGTSIITSANLYDTTWNEAGTSYTYTTSDANTVTTTWAYNSSNNVTSLLPLGTATTRTKNPDTVTLTAAGRRVGKIVATDEAGNSSNVKVYVNISPTYKVTLSPNGGSWSSSSCRGTDVSYSSSKCKKEVTYKYTYGSLPTPTRTDYKFLGWFKSTGSAGSTKITSSDIYNTVGDTTIYAKWRKNDTDCNPVKTKWNNTDGNIKITTNTSLAISYRKVGKDTNFTSLGTGTSKTTTGQKHFRYIYRAGSTTEHTCDSKYDDNKPYTPYITDVKKRTSNSSIIGYSCKITTTGSAITQAIDCDEETTSPTTCTIDISCKYDGNKACGISIWSVKADQSQTDYSGKSGIYRRYYKLYYYDDNGTLKNTCEYWDEPGGDPSNECSSYWGKSETYAIDNAGNKSSKKTTILNYHWHN